jgi:hypothetical protein
MLSETGTHPSRESAARSVVGRPGKKTNGSALAAMSGTLSTRLDCAPPAFTSGRRRNASLAADGRRIRTGMPYESIVATELGDLQ